MPEAFNMRTIVLIATAATLFSVSAQDTGVPACDNLLKVYDTCVIPKSPPANQAQLKGAFDQMRTNWKAVAATPEGKAQLDPVCKQTAEQMKQQLAPLGCAF
jgi:hypothetical protein